MGYAVDVVVRGLLTVSGNATWRMRDLWGIAMCKSAVEGAGWGQNARAADWLAGWHAPIKLV